MDKNELTYASELYNKAIFIEEAQNLITKKKEQAFVKLGILIYTILIAIIPGIPLAFTQFFMANFFQLAYIAIYSLIISLPVSIAIAFIVNCILLKKGSTLMKEHRDIQELITQISEYKNKYPELKQMSLKKLKRNLNEKQKAYKKEQGSRNNSSLRLEASENPFLSLIKRRQHTKKELKENFY